MPEISIRLGETVKRFEAVPDYSLSSKEADILCGLIVYPDQRLVHQIAAECTPETAFARSSHTSVPMLNNLRACKRLAKLGLIYVKSVWRYQLEYTASTFGHAYARTHERATLSAHKSYAAAQKRKRRK